MNLTKFYTDNSISSPERIYIDVPKAIAWNLTRNTSTLREHILGLNTYPVVEGFTFGGEN